jgi:hypothetical protein
MEADAMTEVPSADAPTPRDTGVNVCRCDDVATGAAMCAPEGSFADGSSCEALIVEDLFCWLDSLSQCAADQCTV